MTDEQKEKKNNENKRINFLLKILIEQELHNHSLYDDL